MFKKQFEIAARNFKRLSLESVQQEPTQLAQNKKDIDPSNNFKIDDIDQFLDENVTGSEVCCFLNKHRLIYFLKT